MAGEVRTRAVVAKTTKYGESDLVVTLVTEAEGVIKAFARGAAKSVKRFAGCFEPFTGLEAVLKPGRADDALWRIDSAEILSQRRGISGDLGRISAGAVMLELASRIPALPGEYAEAYTLLTAVLDHLGSASDPAALLAGYWVKHMSVTGNSIVLSVCKDCGCDIGDVVCYTGGEGCVCTKCGSAEMHALNKGLTGFIRHVNELPPERLDRLRLATSLREEVLGFLKDCTRALTDVSPATLKDSLAR